MRATGECEACGNVLYCTTPICNPVVSEPHVCSAWEDQERYGTLRETEGWNKAVNGVLERLAIVIGVETDVDAASALCAVHVLVKAMRK